MVRPFTNPSAELSPPPGQTPSEALAIPMRALLAGARRKERVLLDRIRSLVRVESPSDNKAAVDACASHAASLIAASPIFNKQARVTLHPQRGFGGLLQARFGQPTRPGDPKPILLLGHLDTVWPLGTLKSMPCRISGGRLSGPGSLDMKAGVAMALTAVEILAEARALSREIILLLTGDEEVGSPVSRPFIERVASPCAAVYVLEPAQGLACKTARKGTAQWRIDIKGVAAHAGVDFEKGASALRELAGVIETVSSWTDLKRGLTVSAGVAGGGTRINVIPSEAWTEIDVRIARRADASRIARKFAALKPSDRRCTLSIAGGINRPPMERTRSTIRLFERARSLAREIGLDLQEAATGGASDGNFTSALGIPTLDGMGAVGEGAHAPHEFILIEHLAPRTALLAGMLMG
jgi:glutamate carboxypeptidase